MQTVSQTDGQTDSQSDRRAVHLPQGQPLGASDLSFLCGQIVFCYWLHGHVTTFCVEVPCVFAWAVGRTFEKLISWGMKLDQPLMIGWRKKSWNPERVASVVTLPVYVSVNELQDTPFAFWPRNLIFGLNDPWDMGKKRLIFSSKFSFLCFLFLIKKKILVILVNLNVLVNVCFQATG